MSRDCTWIFNRDRSKFPNWKKGNATKPRYLFLIILRSFRFDSYRKRSARFPTVVYQTSVEFCPRLCRISVSSGGSRIFLGGEAGSRDLFFSRNTCTWGSGRPLSYIVLGLFSGQKSILESSFICQDAIYALKVFLTSKLITWRIMYFVVHL